MVSRFQGDNGRRLVGRRPRGGAPARSVVDVDGPLGVVVLDGHRVRPAARRRPDHDLGRRLRQPRRDRDGGPVDRRWFLAEGATHGAVQPVLPAAEPGRDAGDTSTSPTCARRLRRRSRCRTRSPPAVAADHPVDAVPGARRDRRLGAHRLETCRSSSSARCTWTPRTRRRCSAPATPARGVTRRATRAGSWPRARPAAFFDLYYLIANPSTQADARARHLLLPSGAPIVKEYDVAAQSRLTISVDGEDRAAARHAGVGDRRIAQRASASSSSDRCGGRARASGRRATCPPASTMTARRWGLAAGGVGRRRRRDLRPHRQHRRASPGPRRVTALRSAADGAAAVTDGAAPRQQPRQRRR